MILEVKKTIKKTTEKNGSNGNGGKNPITAEMIAKKAYLLYEKRGCQDGHADEDWAEAKRILEAGE